MKPPSPGQDLLKLDLNEHSEGAPVWAQLAAQSFPDEHIWRYVDRFDFERKMADFYALDPAQVLATNGGDESIFYLYSALTADTPVIVPQPTFGYYEELATHWPLTLVSIPPMADLRLDWSALMHTVSQHRNALIVLVRPNNPTGELTPRTDLIALLDLCRKQQSRLLLDEAYAEFAEDHALDLLDHHPHLIILRTFSKAYGLAGLRLGYLLANGEQLNALRPRVMPYNVSSFTLFIGSQAFDATAQAETKRYTRAVCETRDRLYQWLCNKQIPVFASQANYLLLDLGDARANFAAAVLCQAGISVRRFSRDYLLGRIRITIPADGTRLMNALQRVFAPDLVCLDVDGCLLDTHESFDAAVIACTEQLGGGTVTAADLADVRAEGGFNDDNRLTHELLKRRGVQVPYQDVVAHFRALYIGTDQQQGLYKKEQPFVDEATLQRWHSQSPLALVTGRNREELALVHQLISLPPDIQPITVDDVAVGKPDPAGILKAASTVKAESVWMVGDMVDDIRAAVAAGAVPIGVGSDRVDLLYEAGAAIVLPTLADLDQLLG